MFIISILDPTFADIKKWRNCHFDNLRRTQLLTRHLPLSSKRTNEEQWFLWLFQSRIKKKKIIRGVVIIPALKNNIFFLTARIFKNVYHNRYHVCSGTGFNKNIEIFFITICVFFVITQRSLGCKKKYLWHMLTHIRIWFIPFVLFWFLLLILCDAIDNRFCSYANANLSFHSLRSDYNFLCPEDNSKLNSVGVFFLG